MEDEDRRMNQFIDFVNSNKDKSELNPPIQDEHENVLFDKLQKEVTELRKTNPHAKLANIDSEWGPIGCGYDMD